MTLTRRAAQSQSVRKPLEPRHANRPDDFQRSIRPRPLHIEDRVQPGNMLDVDCQAIWSKTAFDCCAMLITTACPAFGCSTQQAAILQALTFKHQHINMAAYPWHPFVCCALGLLVLLMWNIILFCPALRSAQLYCAANDCLQVKLGPGSCCAAQDVGHCEALNLVMDYPQQRCSQVGKAVCVIKAPCHSICQQVASL